MPDRLGWFQKAGRTIGALQLLVAFSLKVIYLTGNIEGQRLRYQAAPENMQIWTACVWRIRS